MFDSYSFIVEPQSLAELHILIQIPVKHAWTAMDLEIFRGGFSFTKMPARLEVVATYTEAIWLLGLVHNSPRIHFNNHVPIFSSYLLAL